MKSILYIGMDVHSTNYTLCAYCAQDDQPFAVIQVKPDYREILKYLKKVEENYGQECEFVCGYEAGGLGYSLYNELTAQNVKCVILAPSTMPVSRKGEIKTDRRDAARIAKCLAYHTYSAVFVPTAEDDAVKEYIRMRDSAKDSLKRIKQQIIALCMRHGKAFEEGKHYWTIKHLEWLKKLDFGNAILNEAFQEYMVLYSQVVDKVERFDKRIEELATDGAYAEKVKKLTCFIGVSTLTALSMVVEVGDFHRFKSAKNFSSYLGLVPGEQSSGDKQHRTGITKSGNTHLRKLLVEAAQCFSRCRSSAKSKRLKEKQAGNSSETIAYADRANERLRKKFFKMALRSKWNIAATAIARELSCFMWGMMTDNIA